MQRAKAWALGALVAFLSAGQGHAQSLRVSPITLDLPPEAMSAFLNIGNDSGKPVTVQARVFRWTQVNGEDKLERTGDIAVSPPQLTVAHNSGGIVRIVRIARTPVASEECYRVLLDEIPDRSRMQAGTITLAMRHSVPVFFGSKDPLRGALQWSVAGGGGKFTLHAENTGQKRFKLTGLRVTDSEARALISIDGLAGYVLGGQIKAWELAVPKGVLKPGTPLRIEAKSKAGPINASANVGKGG